MYNVGLLVYGAVQMEQIEDVARQLPADIRSDIWKRTRPYLVAIPCILGLGTVLLAFLAWKLYDEFAWTIYKHISADLRMKRRYLTFQIYIAVSCRPTRPQTDTDPTTTAPEVRFLLFPGIHGSICRHRRALHHRVLSHYRRHPGHHSHPAASRLLLPPRSTHWHHWRHRKFHTAPSVVHS